MAKIKSKVIGLNAHRNRARVRRVNPDTQYVDRRFVPKMVASMVNHKDPEIRTLCARCSRAGRYMLIDGTEESWLCMEHYFSY